MVWTNIHKQRIFEEWFENGGTAPTYFHFQLATSDTGTWNADLSSCSQVTLVAEGNGYYASGIRALRDGTDISVPAFGSEAQSNDYVEADIGVTLEWTATGGNIPSTGSPPYYLIMTDDNATPTQREIFGFWSLGGNVTLIENQVLTLTGATLRGT